MGNSDNPSQGDAPVNRRRMLQLLGATGTASIAGLSGCTSGGGDQTTTTTQGNDGTTTTAGGDGTTTTTSSGEWADLSGKEVHVLSDEPNKEFQNVFKGIASAFEEATGASVNLEFVAAGTVKNRLSQLLQAGDPPEIYTGTGASTTQFVHEGVAGSVDDALEFITDQFGAPPENTRVTNNGSDYHIPLWTNSGVHWYRDDLYDEAPSTWDKLLAQAEQADDPSGVRGYFQPAGQSLCTDSYVLSFAYSNDARVFTESGGEISVDIGNGSNRDRWVETLQFFKDAHQYSPNNSDAGCGQLIQALSIEQSATSWYPGTRPKESTVSQEKDFAGNVRAVVQPEKRSELTHGFINSFSTFKQANTDAANEFLKFALQKKFFIDLLLITPLHNAPVYEAHIQSDQYQTAIDNLPDAWTDDDVNTALSSAENFLPIINETSTPNPFAGAVLGSRKLDEMLYDVSVGGNDPGDVVDSYHQEISDVVNDAKS